MPLTRASSWWQVHLERTFRDLARATRVPCIIICDKGLMDGMCYVSDDEWRAVLERCKLSTVEARDQRYTACFHMMTAADGAEAFYHENVERVGAARPGQGYPSIEEAREFDERCQSAWTGHPRFTVISNAGEIDFEGKLHNLICAVAQHVGIEVPREKKFRKYLLTREPTVEDFEGEEIPVEHFEVEKVFLAQNKSQRERGISSFVRRRSQGSHASYTRTNSVSSSTGETIEMKKVGVVRCAFPDSDASLVTALACISPLGVCVLSPRRSSRPRSMPRTWRSERI